MNLVERSMRKQNPKATPPKRKKVNFAHITKRTVSPDTDHIIMPKKTGKLSLTTIDRIVNNAITRIEARNRNK